MNWRGLWACAMLAILGGCGSGTVRENFYTLAAPSGAARSVAGAGPLANATIHVGPVSVPEAVDRVGLVLRTGPHSVEISEAHRWAEPLKAAIPRVLAESLSRTLGATRVTASRMGASPSVDYRIAVEVQRFESSLQEGAGIDALWTITPAKGSARTGRSTYQEAPVSADPAAVVAAHNRALGKVAADIARALAAP